MHLVQTLPTVLTTTPREGAMINPASAMVTAAAEGNLKILNILWVFSFAFFSSIFMKWEN